MIRFTLTCDQDHRFESWFQSGDAFEKLRKTQMITCSHCGSTDVNKSIMAPAVKTKVAATPPVDIAKLKAEVEANADYVGTKFAKEARAMHVGDAPERAIYGQANLKEAKSLLEDGVPVLPLPFMPRKEVN